MGGSEGASDAALDIEARLDRALESTEPKVRPPTKTEQLRKQRAKIAALQNKGLTLNEIAAIVGTSKDTLRSALKPKTKAKKVAARAAHPVNGQVDGEETKLKTTPGPPVVVSPGRKRKFPSSDDL